MALYPPPPPGAGSGAEGGAEGGGWARGGLAGLAVASCDQAGGVAAVALPALDFRALPAFQLKDATCAWASAPSGGLPLVACSARARALVGLRGGEGAEAFECACRSVPAAVAFFSLRLFDVFLRQCTVWPACLPQPLSSPVPTWQGPACLPTTGLV